MMMSRFVHWRYLASELAYRWRRTALLIGGIALAATLVVMLDVLGRSFAMSQRCRSGISAPT